MSKCIGKPDVSLLRDAQHKCREAYHDISAHMITQIFPLMEDRIKRFVGHTDLISEIEIAEGGWRYTEKGFKDAEAACFLLSRKITVSPDDYAWEADKTRGLEGLYNRNDAALQFTLNVSTLFYLYGLRMESKLREVLQKERRGARADFLRMTGTIIGALVGLCALLTGIWQWLVRLYKFLSD